jgi:hypothetical protein
MMVAKSELLVCEDTFRLRRFGEAVSDDTPN